MMDTSGHAGAEGVNASKAENEGRDAGGASGTRAPLRAYPPALALVPPPAVVTRSGRVSKPVKDAYVERNKRSITRLIAHDAKQSMLDDVAQWRRTAEAGSEADITAAFGPGANATLRTCTWPFHWPLVNVHDTYTTVQAEYARVHIALFGTAPPSGEEDVPEGYDDDRSYVEGDSQRGDASDSEAEEEEEEEEEEDSTSEEEEEEEKEEDEEEYATPPRRRARADSVAAQGMEGPLPLPPPGGGELVALPASKRARVSPVTEEGKVEGGHTGEDA